MLRRCRIALAKAASVMVSEAAIGRVSTKKGKARQAQLRNCAWSLSPATPTSLKQCRSAAKASAVTWHKDSHCAEGSASRTTVAVSSCGHKLSMTS
jgi:hypothetical protein